MLNYRHIFAQQLLDHDELRIYKSHMCGLCHGLGDHFSFSSRVITTHDMTLLNMLVTAQTEPAPEMVHRRCPLNPLLIVTLNSNTASKFAAATAVELAWAGIMDHLEDNKSFDIKNSGLKILLEKPYQSALAISEKLGFDTGIFEELVHSQRLVEQDGHTNPALPTARTSAALFAMTSVLANNLSNQKILSKIGMNYGVFIYLQDALDDYLQDMYRSEFNPLRRFSVESSDRLVLKHFGLEWVLNQLNEVIANISADFQEIYLFRYQGILETLLCEPIRQTIHLIEDQLTRMEDLSFARFKVLDGLKAAIFLLPLSIATRSPTLIGSCSPVNSGPNVNYVGPDDNPGMCLGLLGGMTAIAVACGICRCLFQKRDAFRVEPTVKGSRIYQETNYDICSDSTGCS